MRHSGSDEGSQKAHHGTRDLARPVRRGFSDLRSRCVLSPRELTARAFPSTQGDSESGATLEERRGRTRSVGETEDEGETACKGGQGVVHSNHEELGCRKNAVGETRFKAAWDCRDLPRPFATALPECPVTFGRFSLARTHLHVWCVCTDMWRWQSVSLSIARFCICSN